MAFQGTSLIGYSNGQASGSPFHGMNPASGAELPEPFFAASKDEVDRAARLAEKAFPVYRSVSSAKKAAFLRAIAKELEAPLGTVKAQLHRARELMYDLVKGKEEHI